MNYLVFISFRGILCPEIVWSLFKTKYPIPTNPVHQIRNAMTPQVESLRAILAGSTPLPVQGEQV